MALPASNIFGQTFVKYVRHNVPTGQTGTYRYTSEYEDMVRKQGANSQLQKVLYGYFHPDNVHPGSTDLQSYDKIRIEQSTFGRDILHLKESRQFAPWSVLERYTPANKNEPLELDFLLMFGLGRDFVMMSADITFHVASYNSEDRTRDDVNPKFIQVYRQPIDFNSLEKNKFYTKKMATVSIQPDYMRGEFLAFKCTIQARVENNQNMVPLITDMYLEGFSFLPHNRMIREDPKCNCNIF